MWNEIRGRLVAYFTKRTHDADYAQDLAQETMIKVLDRWEQLDDQSRLLPWVYAIARTTVLDRQKTEGREQTRRQKLAQIDPETKTAHVPEPDADEALKHDLKGCMLSHLTLLPEKYQEALRAVELDGLTRAEFAAEHGLSESGAKSRVQRARAALHESLKSCCSFEQDVRGKVLSMQPKATTSPCEVCN